MMYENSMVMRYISGETIRQIADDLKLPTQMVMTDIYTSPDFAEWVFSKPCNDDKFLNRFLEVYTNDRERDCAILKIGKVRYNHVKHALITNGELKANREGIYSVAQIKALEKYINKPESKSGERNRIIRRYKVKALYDVIHRATGVRVTEYRRSMGLSKAKLHEELGTNKSVINNCIRFGLLTIPYTDEQIENLFRAGLAMHPDTNNAAPRWRGLIAAIRDIGRYQYVSTKYLYSIVPSVPKTVLYHLRNLPVRLRLYPEQNNLFGYDREAAAQIIGDWLGPKYRWAVRQVDGDWLPLKCGWYDWKTS